MLEFLRNISGEDFLVYFWVYYFVTLIIVYIVSKRDYTNNLDLPDPSSLSPLEISYLVNGIKSVLATSVFNLWRKKIISIKTDSRRVVLSKKNGDTSDLNEIELKLYNSIKKPTSYNNLLSKSELQSYETLFEKHKSVLLSKALIFEEYGKKRMRVFRNIAFILLLPGIIKLSMGILYNKPSTYLIFTIIIMIIITTKLFSYKRKEVTRFGKNFIKDCQDRFAWVKDTPAEKRDYSDDIFLYSVAVFGFSSIIGNKLGDRLDNPLVDGEFASGCSGSGCSGGGCGGGSGCGGGCGGCGGD